MRILQVNIVVLLLAATVMSHAKTTIIYAGELLAVPGEKPLQKQTITIEDGVVTKVESGFTEFKNAEGMNLIQLRDSFVMPGMMDMHVHLQGELGPNRDREALKMSAQLKGMRTIHYGMNTLLAGFTTVRDVGSDSQYMYALSLIHI